MGTLFEDARRHVEAAVRDLEGEDDFLPFLAVRTHEGGILCVGIMMPDTGGERDVVADMMAAICVLHRATEAAFASAAWMVTREDGKMPDERPSECADRQEIVFLSTVDDEGTCRLHTATMVRENNMAGVGVWEDHPDTMSAGGRFFDAIATGLDLGKRLPPEMGEFFDREIAEGNESRLIDMMMRTFQDARKAGFARDN